MNIKQSKNRETGTVIETLVYDNNTVTLNCADHDQCCDFDNPTQGRRFASTPSEWCGECAGIVYGVAEVWM